MIPGLRYRSKSTGSIYVVEKMGTSLADPCVLRLASPSSLLEQAMRATWERDVEHNRSTLTWEQYQDEWLTVRVEPAWFEHAATEAEKR